MLETRLDSLRTTLAAMGRVVIAYSGGVDSAFLAAVANEVLGRDALAITALSPSVSASERADAERLALTIGLNWRTVETHEMDDPDYVRNDGNRCYHCKDELYSVLARVAAEEGIPWVADGCNTDDLGDYRPGRRAAAEHGVRSPLVEAGLSKAEIRQLSRDRGLPTWDKPAMACLASRIPYGTPVSLEALSRIEQAEAVIRASGVRQVRVRHHGEIARIETDREGMLRLLEDGVRDTIVEQLRVLGYRFVALDLAGYRSGSLNELLTLTPIAR